MSSFNKPSSPSDPIPKYQAGQRVELLILRETDLGFVARILGPTTDETTEADEGLLYHDEIFERLEPGQKLPGYIKKVREDGAIDLLLQAFGNFGAQDIGEKILKVLRENKGFLAINDKTPPEKIYELFGVSKKKYKIALGGLYKKRLVLIEDRGLTLLAKT